MKFNLAHLLLAFGVGVVAASGLLVPNTQASQNQPHMVTALDDLRAARHELEAAEHDKAGHRVNAINFTNSAIAEVRAGIAAGN